MTNLSHTASFHSNERITPANRGIKHLGRDARARLVANTSQKPSNLPDEVAAIGEARPDEATYVTGTVVTIDEDLLAGSAAAPG
jgi:hypothetical protein